MTPRIQENDVVSLKQPTQGVPRGAIGTIIIDYIGGQSVEVEFTLKHGTKLVTVPRGDVERLEVAR